MRALVCTKTRTHVRTHIRLSGLNYLLNTIHWLVYLTIKPPPLCFLDFILFWQASAYQLGKKPRKQKIFLTKKGKNKALCSTKFRISVQGLLHAVSATNQMMLAIDRSSGFIVYSRNLSSAQPFAVSVYSTEVQSSNNGI